MDDPELAMLLGSLHQTPTDDLLWLAVADRLEESGQAGPATVLRLGRKVRRLKEGMKRLAVELEVRSLLSSGVRPCVPVVTNSIGMDLALIPAGTFWMGSPPRVGDSDEKPRHKVRIARPFWLGVFPVTQAQYKAVVGTTPSWFAPTGGGCMVVKDIETRDFPVEQVSWRDAVAFCEALSALPEEKAARRVYGLPTEAEWEYACRAGLVSGSYSFGDALDETMANFRGSKLDRPVPVGSYPPNAWGLFDMHGNAWEWCHDWYSERYYAVSPGRSPQGPAMGHLRVLRGGSWNYAAEHCRAAYRVRSEPASLSSQSGFRVCFRLA